MAAITVTEVNDILNGTSGDDYTDGRGGHGRLIGRGSGSGSGDRFVPGSAGPGSRTVLADGCDPLVKRAGVEIARVGFAGDTAVVQRPGSGAHLGTRTLLDVEHPGFAIDSNTSLVIHLSNGVEVDSHIAGGTVFADANENGVLDDGESFTTTDPNGNFTLDGGTGPLVMYGGTDIATGFANLLTFRAPEGATVVSPLTTLVQILIVNGSTPEDAQDAVAAAFGIDTDVDLATFDPLAAPPGDPDALAVQQASATVVVLVSEGAELGGGDDDTQSSMFAALAEYIVTQPAPVDLADTGVVTAILEAVLASDGIAATAQQIADAAAAIDAATTIEEVSAAQVEGMPNDAPVATITPASYDATEQVALDLKGTLLVADVDAGSGSITVTLSVDYGIVHVALGTSGATIDSGNDSASLTLSGTLDQINALLSSDATSVVTYTPDTNAPPPGANLTLLVNDNGNGGDGGALDDTATASIAIADTPELHALGNRVFRDADGDSLFDAGEGLNGVTVELLDSLGAAIASTVTSGDGGYLFGGLPAGDYSVRVVGTTLPLGLLSLTGAPDPDDDFDGDDNGAPSGLNYVSAAITLTDNSEPTGEDGDSNTNLTLDFGFATPAPTVDLNGAGDGVDFTGSFTEDGAESAIGVNIAVTAPALPITGATITITGPLAGDQLTIDGTLPATITVSGPVGTTTLTLTGAGTPADWAAALSLVRYSSASDNADAFGGDPGRDITVVVSDGVASSAEAIAAIAVYGANDNPLVTDLSGDSVAWTEDLGEVLLDLDGNAEVSDVDSANFAGGSLEAGVFINPSVEDLVFITNTADVALEGADVKVDDILIGTATYGGGDLLVVTFNSHATPERVQALLRAIAYTNLGGDNPTGGSRSIVYLLKDGDGGTDTGSVTVDVTAIDDAPTLTATAAHPAYIEGAGGADLFGSVTASTVEAGQTLTALTLTVTNVTDGASEILRFDGSDVTLTNGNSVTTTNSLNVNVALSGSIATLSFSGATLSAAQLQTLVDALSYRNTSQAPTDANRVVTITQLVDSGASAAPDDNVATLTVASTVNVEPVNDAPTSTLLANDTRTYVEGSAPVTLDVVGNATIADVDSPNFAGGTLTLTIADSLFEDNLLIINTAIVTTSGANILANGTTIGTFSGGGGGDPLVISFNTNATPAAVQLFVRAIGYTNDGGDIPNGGLRTIVWALNDGDGDALGGNPNLSFNTRVSVLPVNDPPTGADVTVEIDEDEVYHFSTADFAFFDVEGDQPFGVRVEGAPANGTLFFDPDGNGPNSAFEASPGMTIVWSDIQAGKFYYVPDADGNGIGFDSFTFAVVDSGGAADASPNIFTFDVAPVNDAAIITGDASGDVTEAGGVLNGTLGDADDSGDLDAADIDNAADAWQAVAPGAASIGGYGIYALSATGVWTYTVNDNNAAVQALIGAATLTDTFSALTEDGTSQTVTITIHAQNDAAAITGDSSGDVTEAGGIANGTAGDADDTGDLNSTDVDGSADVWQIVAPGAASIGGYGTYALTAAGVWTYVIDDSDAAVQALNGAATLTDTFTALTEDGTSQTVTITIEAQNDAAVITGTSVGDVTEAGGLNNGTAGDADDTGDLDAADVDNTTDAWQEVAAGGTTDNGYGSYALSATGEWTYTLDDTDPDVQALNGTETLTDTFTALTEDGTSQTVTITIEAQNDAAVITGTSVGDVTEAGGIANGTPGDPTASGNLGATDVDDTADAWQEVAAGGTTDNGYGSYALSATGEWTYTLDDTDPDVQALNGTETLTDTFDVLTQDGSAQTVTITIKAQNDAAVIGGDIVGDVTEAGGIANGSAGDATASGNLGATDVDDAADAWQEVAAGGATANGYGTYQLSATGEWTYTLDDTDPDVQALNDSETLTDTFTALTEDGTSQTVTITINGKDDAGVAHDDQVTTTEASPVSGSVFADTGSGPDSDVDDDPPVVVAVNGVGASVGSLITLGSGARLTLNADGTFTYDPNHAFDATPAPGSGASNTPATDSFAYTLSGGDTATVHVTITGLDTDDLLLGTAGLDTLAGGGGNDIYVVANSGDTVTELANGGNDSVSTSVDYQLAAGSHVERLSANIALTTPLKLTGNEFVNLVEGNAGGNVLDGKGGADAMWGYSGNDTYYVDNGLDTVAEGAGGGSDTIVANVSYTLGAGQEVELLRTPGSTTTFAVNFTGNEFGNALIGNAAANILDGKGGADTMYGYGGNDTYYVDHAGDIVAEAVGGGSDTIIANASYSLGAGQEVELLRTLGSATTYAVNLTGNELANTLVGNAAANVLDGKGGADAMYGYAGNDTYYVDNGADTVAEAGGGGSDTIIANASYTLGAGQEVELLRTPGSTTTFAVNLTGNALANTIVGNAAANVLDGKSGADALYGYGGADSFAFTTAPGAGNVDTIGDLQAGIDKILLENAVFTGLAAGALAPGAFRTGSAAVDADDRIIYNSVTGQLLFDADGVGGAAAVQFASLSNGLAITASDFIVI